jgi:hypothetical protein
MNRCLCGKLKGELMMTKEDFKEKIEEQLAKWKSTIDGESKI